MDVLGFIADAFYLGCIGLYHLWCLLPFPSVAELFKSLVVFIALYPIRNYMERRWLKKRFSHRKAMKAPSSSEHQAAASAIGDLFSH